LYEALIQGCVAGIHELKTAEAVTNKLIVIINPGLKPGVNKIAYFHWSRFNGF
jgi:hypothetical protein